MTELTDDECDMIKIYHSQPETVDPEKVGETTWFVEYRIPLALLEKYTSVVKPAAGTVWKANFYKCADRTSHPHWLTWSEVDNPTPSFHIPTSFGTLNFK